MTNRFYVSEEGDDAIVAKISYLYKSLTHSTTVSVCRGCLNTKFSVHMKCQDVNFLRSHIGEAGISSFIRYFN